MKKVLAFRTVLHAVAILAVLTSCQSTAINQTERASKKEELLAQAGFKPKAVTTAKQQQQVSQLAVDRVSAVKYHGKVYYVFPTAKKDQILVGNQAQFNSYKRSLAAEQASQKTKQEQQMLQGTPEWVGETAGPRHIQVEVFDGFGPLNPTEGD
jgi:hypothetical protein